VRKLWKVWKFRLTVWWPSRCLGGRCARSSGECGSFAVRSGGSVVGIAMVSIKGAGFTRPSAVLLCMVRTHATVLTVLRIKGFIYKIEIRATRCIQKQITCRFSQRLFSNDFAAAILPDPIQIAVEAREKKYYYREKN